MLHPNALDVAPGVRLWSGGLDAQEQKLLVDGVLRRVQDAPFYRPLMPSRKPISARWAGIPT
jgi:hypothetical protein